MNSADQFALSAASTPSRQSTCVIVDDEQRARDTLSGILKRHFPELLEVGQAASVDESVALVKSTRPDIIFLDIEIVGGTGFDVLDKLDTSYPLTVITTAYSNYEAESLRYPNTWFLMKPISISALREVLRDVIGKAGAPGTADR